MNTRKITTRAILLLASSALPFSAHAQEVANDDGAEEEDVIVVTGSRIAIDPNIGSPAPILSLGSEELTETGSGDVVDVLREIPALSTSTNTESSIDGVFSAAVGQATLNLRGLGAGRTLVLVNGRRHVSGVAGAQIVDINSIPTALIESVETVTGGASAVYGADAVTGVVNFILRDDFEGIEANVQSGISHQGDAWRINGDLTWGANFADGRGNITITGEYARNDELQFGDRSFSRNNGIFDDQGNPALRFQTGELSASETPNFFASNIIGDLIPTGNLGFTPTAAEQALIDRALAAPSRLIAGDPRFSLSSAGGIVAPGFIGLSDGPDINGNGTADCLESAVGFNSTFNPGAFGAAGGCAVINADGSVSVYQDGLITGLFNQFGGDGIQNNFDVNSLIPETERWSVNLNAKYEFSEAAEVFFEGKYVSSSAEFQAQPNTFYDLLTIRSDNAFITPELQPFVEELSLPQFGFTNPGFDPLFDTGNTEGFYITRDPTDLGPNRNRNEFETYRFVGGLRGELTDNARYEISANYGKFEQTTLDANRVILDRFFAAIDAVDDGNGNIVCRSDIDPTPSATTPFGIPSGDPGFFTFNPGDGQCRPANILGGVGAISQEAIDFITATIVNEFELEQFVVNAIVTGDTGSFFELPGGAIDYVVGVEFRDEQSTSTFDPLVRGVVPVTTPDANAGDLLRNLPNSQNSLVFDPASVIDDAGGSFDVLEVFGEVRLPIVSGQPLAELLELRGAARYAQYSTIGGAFTWSVNGLYAPVQDILIRGTYSEAVRAPNINELFNPAQGAFFRPIDPCDASELANGPDPALRQANCLAFFQQAGFNGAVDGGGNYTYVDPLTARFSGSVSGNPDLSEETATTWTVGAQVTPSFLPGFIFSVDYYNIEIEDAISTVSAQDIVNNCVDSASIDNQFCPLIDRNAATGGFTFLRQVNLNFARLETAGVEFSSQYSFDLGEHRFTANVAATWVDKLDRFFDPSDLSFVDPELGELQRPEWAGNASLTWSWSDFSLTWSTSYQDSQALRAVEIEDVGTVFSEENGIASDVFIHDVSFNYDINDRYTVYGGVNNIFNRQPFVTEQAFPVSPVGTLFFLGARANF